jgi:hypothetical protein
MVSSAQTAMLSGGLLSVPLLAFGLSGFGSRLRDWRIRTA